MNGSFLLFSLHFIFFSYIHISIYLCSYISYILCFRCNSAESKVNTRRISNILRCYDGNNDENNYQYCTWNGIYIFIYYIYSYIRILQVRVFCTLCSIGHTHTGTRSHMQYGSVRCRQTEYNMHNYYYKKNY